jgi:hypothetical protein
MDSGTSTGEGASSSLPISSSATNPKVAGASDAQWDDEALAAATTRKGAAVAPTTGVFTKDWAEMKALDLKTNGNEQENIAKKLEVEETRAKLAAAREGMEREAQKIKEEKEKKELAAKANTASRFAGASAGMSSSGDAGGAKWVSSRLRAEGTSLSDRFGSVGGSQKLNTDDENLFPDLAAADAIIEKQKHEQPAFKAPKTTPVGGGATWGSRPKLNLKPKTQPAKEDETQASTPDAAIEPVQVEVEAPKTEEPTPVEAKEVAAPAMTDEPALAAAVAATPTPASIKPTKKKKKDLSTFGKK